MLNDRDIILFTPFHFPNGAESKDKFFVVLKNSGNDLVLSVLPSSKSYFPNDLEQVNGCHEYPDRSFNCFIIPNTEQITECGKCFDETTYLYGGYGLMTLKIDELKATYPVEDINYHKFGVMSEERFKDIIECFKKSSQTKQKHRRML